MKENIDSTISDSTLIITWGITKDATFDEIDNATGDAISTAILIPTSYAIHSATFESTYDFYMNIIDAIYYATMYAITEFLYNI